VNAGREGTDVGTVYVGVGRTVAVVEDVTVRCTEGRMSGAALGRGGDETADIAGEDPSSCGCDGRITGEGDGATNGSDSGNDSDCGVSATLNLLAGRVNGLFGLSCASCEGRRTNGDCLSGDNIGDACLDEDWSFVGDVMVGVAARTVDGVLVTGDSGRLKGDARGEKDIMECLAFACDRLEAAQDNFGWRRGPALAAKASTVCGRELWIEVIVRDANKHANMRICKHARVRYGG